jgi:hypothetical protein
MVDFPAGHVWLLEGIPLYPLTYHNPEEVNVGRFAKNRNHAAL